MKDNVVAEKSYQFSVRIIRLFQYLMQKGEERALVIQVLRSGTSIGANIQEAIGANSVREFTHRINISYKEARETFYWLRLLHDTQILDHNQALSLKQDCEELLRILGTIQKTMKSREKKYYKTL
ncbi:four helix bundle protein [Chitinophaga sp. 212800010-3]|uniref:four helix bundle protein n=1 Tax=unclassified Chitinophaga TaxID=2619133 RepID=UPI002DE4F459|nr:Four helix bundle protein [Chitinophaga sp. 212800010-3]